MQLCLNFQWAGNRRPCSNIQWNRLSNNQHYWESWKEQILYTEAQFLAERVNVNMLWKSLRSSTASVPAGSQSLFPRSADWDVLRGVLRCVCVLIQVQSLCCFAGSPSTAVLCSQDMCTVLLPLTMYRIISKPGTAVLIHSNWDVQIPFYSFFPCGDAWQDDRQFAWVPWGAVFLLNSMWGHGVCVPADNCHFYL